MRKKTRLKMNDSDSSDDDYRDITKLLNSSALFSPKFDLPVSPDSPHFDISDIKELSSGNEEDDESSDEEGKQNVELFNSAQPGTSSSKSALSRETPIGFFWDIENCQVPRGCSAVAIVSAIRKKFLTGRYEAEFIVVCDVKKEQTNLIQELNVAQVDVMHVCGTQKNAADDKLRQCMRRFVELHISKAMSTDPSPSIRPALVLLSGDINFAADLSDFKYRKNMHVILVHNQNVNNALIACVSENHCFVSLTASLPRYDKGTLDLPNFYLEVSGVPAALPGQIHKLSQRLRQLADNCGGRVAHLKPPFATLRFQTYINATRALKRMDGEDVFGHKIKLVPPIKTYYGNTFKSSSDEGYHTGPTRHPNATNTASVFPPINGFPPLQPPNMENGDCGHKDYSGMNKPKFNEEPPGSLFRRAPIKTPTGYRSIKGVHGNQPKNMNNRHHIRQLVPVPRVSPSPSPILSVTSSQSPSPVPFDLPIWRTSERSISENSSETRSGSPPNSPPCVDITVTNLEHSADPSSVTAMLHRIFSEHVQVKSVSVRGSGESLSARVRVVGAGAAQLAVSRLHKHRVRGRRLVLSLAPPPPATPITTLKTQVATILQSAPDQQLPLFRLRELYAERHGRALPAADISRLKDICLLLDCPRGRSVKLLKTPNLVNLQMTNEQQEQQWWEESDVCVIHCSNQNEDNGENPPSGIGIIPVYISDMTVFGMKLYSMLSSHGGVILLNSLPNCYAQQFGEMLSVDYVRGVPLEHLITSVKGLALRTISTVKVKKIIVAAPYNPSGSDLTLNGNTSSAEEDVPTSLSSMRALLSRELLDLLRTAPRCQMPFSRLIPSYHLHFGRQCRVADYGYTKLADLLDSLSNTVQVMGEGSNRIITLSHLTQVKRFTADLLKVLRAQPDKSLMIHQLPELYRLTLGREFDIVEYGACRVEDLLMNIAKNCISLGPEEGKLSLPRHRQTPEEMARIRQFASQASELLRHAPNCRLELSRFVPAYHTHFGKQLRVAHYGLPKVQDLFHAIPETVDMWANEDGERVVSLKREAARRVLGSQLCALTLPLSFAALPHAFRSVHGFPLLPIAFGYADLMSLLKNIPEIKITYGEGQGGVTISRADTHIARFPAVNNLWQSVEVPQVGGWGASALVAYRILAGDKCITSGGPPVDNFIKTFRSIANHDPPINVLKQNGCIKIANGKVNLSLMWRCIGRLVSEQGNKELSAAILGELYFKRYQHVLPYDKLGFESIEAVLRYCTEVWEVQGLPGGLCRVRSSLVNICPVESNNAESADLLPSTPPGHKSSGVWSTPPQVTVGPWTAPVQPPAPPEPNMLPHPAPQLLCNKRRVRLAAQFNSPT